VTNSTSSGIDISVGLNILMEGDAEGENSLGERRDLNLARPPLKGGAIAGFELMNSSSMSRLSSADDASLSSEEGDSLYRRS